jgi:predicted phosphodiesterase
MHALTGNRPVVLKALKETIQHLSADKPKTKRAGLKALELKTEAKWSTKRDEMVEMLQRAYQRAQDDPLVRTARGLDPKERPELWYVSNDQTMALFQSAMDEYLDKKAKRGLRKLRTSGAKSQPRQAFIGEQFDTVDPGWLEVVVEKLKIRFKGKHKFIRHKTLKDFIIPLDQQVTIALVGDWGGGNDAARAVAAQVKQRHPDHVIHLGDVYYAGTGKEVRERFLDGWDFWSSPIVAGRSLALNSNHEMYSGGYAYFDLTLKEFKQKASYFSLENENWRLIGLDTGYVDQSLNKEQMEWLTAQLQRSSVKTVLLSHHQLFSGYEEAGSRLQELLKPLLDAGKIYGWFWGHEHLCVIYKQFMNVKARCLGNGCLPYEPPSGPPVHAEVPIEFLNRRKQTGQPSHGMHSFALLSIDGSRMHVDYIDQDGVVAFSEDF